MLPDVERANEVEMYFNRKTRRGRIIVLWYPVGVSSSLLGMHFTAFIGSILTTICRCENNSSCVSLSLSSLYRENRVYRGQFDSNILSIID